MNTFPVSCAGRVRVWYSGHPLQVTRDCHGEARASTSEWVVTRAAKLAAGNQFASHAGKLTGPCAGDVGRSGVNHETPNHGLAASGIKWMHPSRVPAGGFTALITGRRSQSRPARIQFANRPVVLSSIPPALAEVRVQIPPGRP